MQINILTILLSVAILALSACTDRPEESPIELPGLYVGHVSKSESSTTISVPVTIKRENEEVVTVDYEVAEFTADDISKIEDPAFAELIANTDLSVYKAKMQSAENTDDADFVFTSGTLTFSPEGDDSQTINVDFLSDSIYEKDEVFVVRLSNSNADIVNGTGVVKIENDDQAPIATITTFNDNDPTDINEAVGSVVKLKVSLDSLSGVDAQMSLTTVGTVAAYRVDYLIKQNDLPLNATREVVINAGEQELVLDLLLIDDGLAENTEALSLQLSASSDANVASSGIELNILDDDTIPEGRVNNTPLNDSGVSAEYSGTFIDHNDIDGCSSNDACSDEIVALIASYEPYMDANIGRDATHADDTNGFGGFDFTKLDSNGQPTTAVVSAGDDGLDVIPWDCVKDNNTGLIWEVKTDGNLGLRAETRTAYWYDPDSATNGGIAGKLGSFDCAETAASSCNTSYYVADANEARLCGMTGWRLPTVEELRSIINYDKLSGAAYDTNYFAGDTRGIEHVWSSTSYAADPSQAWAIRFEAPVLEEPQDKTVKKLAIRLVNDSQLELVP